jgi:hypothetical protein
MTNHSYSGLLYFCFSFVEHTDSTVAIQIVAVQDFDQSTLVVLFLIFVSKIVIEESVKLLFLICWKILRAL